MECIFCKIIKKEIPAEIILENENVIIFKDINPIAPVHYLAIPKKHIETIDSMSKEDYKDILPDIFDSIKEASNKLGLEKGFRIINNCKEYGGQTVYHIHFHLLSGKKLSWEEL